VHVLSLSPLPHETHTSALSDAYEYSIGVLPHNTLRLQQLACTTPQSSSSTTAPTTATVTSSSSSGRAWDEDALPRFAVTKTCVLNPGSDGCVPSTAAAAVAAVSGARLARLLVTYDLETARVKRQFLGHLRRVNHMCAAPEAWPGCHNLFASCAQSGDVKLWDTRVSGGAAAVTLSTGKGHSMRAVLLVANSSTSSSGSSGGALGSGMMCFAGGESESVWAWDVRGSSAQALYQLSTGNQRVDHLMWHPDSNSLVANCSSHYGLR